MDMKREIINIMLSKITLSVIAQSLLLLFVIMLGSVQSAIVLSALYTLWNGLLVCDWILSRTGRLRHHALLRALPAVVFYILPVVFLGIALGIRW